MPNRKSLEEFSRKSVRIAPRITKTLLLEKSRNHSEYLEEIRSHDSDVETVRPYNLKLRFL